jgi:hypothetical protein
LGSLWPAPARIEELERSDANDYQNYDYDAYQHHVSVPWLRR